MELLKLAGVSGIGGELRRHQENSVPPRSPAGEGGGVHRILLSFRTNYRREKTNTPQSERDFYCLALAAYQALQLEAEFAEIRELLHRRGPGFVRIDPRHLPRQILAIR